MKLLRYGVFGIAIALVCATRAEAQVLLGKVVEKTNGQAISTAEIVVLQGDSFKTALTDTKGNFTIYIASGPFRMRASALGYDATESALTIERFQRLVVNVVLGVDPVQLEPISVVSRRPQLRLGREGFTWRKERAAKTGMGRILDAGDIARYHAMVVSDIVRKQPFMNRSLFTTPYYSPVIRLVGRGSAPGHSDGVAAYAPGVGQFATSFGSEPYGSTVGRYTPCAEDGFRYYINGSPSRVSMELVNAMFSPSELVGLEVYRRHEAPGEFGGGLYPCGTIVIWTR